tara:strand:- start:664 stop:1671 length:1008 start_codon:yes stop_codon:yes gene_type:complete
MSELKRDTNPTSANPIVPDATENSAIGSVTNVSLSQYRNSIKFYYISQSGSDIYFDIDALGWNNNLDKTISKTIFIDGDIGSDNALSPAASFEQSPAYNLLFDVSGTIKGGPGIGGGKPGNVSITGQAGGTALSIISTGGENLVVNVRSSARIYGGGGGGEKGATGAQGATGLCQDFETVRNCNSCPTCPDGWTSTSGCYSGGECSRRRACNWWGSCWFITTGWWRFDDCLNEYEVAGGLGGEGGDGGTGRGFGNEAGALQGDNGGPPDPDNGCNSTQGQPGETGGAGGEWALAGADTNNTGDGGAAGKAIAGTSYSVIGSISSTTLKGDYPATP